MDVSGAVINPTFRATPWDAEKTENSSRKGARIVFVSESNICRSTLAAGIITQMLQEGGLASDVEVESRATRDYTVGEAAHPATSAAAQALGIELPANFAARKFDYTNDTVHFDMILVMDKFTAGDVMREISVFDTINKYGKYTQKVRRLGEFHPELRSGNGNDGQDIDDPLYGNDGGIGELEAVEQVAVVIQEACEGLTAFLKQLRENDADATMYDLLREKMNGMEELEWLAPPMLSKR